VSGLYKKSVAELSRMLKQKEIKPSEICESFLLRHGEAEPEINAYITFDSEYIINRAKELDNLFLNFAEGELPALFGIPVAVKDSICTRDMRTTCASKMLEDFRPPYDAEVISRLKKNGAVIAGKTDMDEFSMGSTGETSYFARENKKGRVNNPYDIKRVPGGSSSGSAAAVAAGSAAIALGADTGGSVRLPAAYCGLVGYKPTYNIISRNGLIAYAGSLDTIGTLARTVSDAALLAGVIGDFKNLKFLNIDAFDLKGKKIGIIKECFEDSNNLNKLSGVCEIYKSLGAEISEISVPMIKNALPAYYIIAMAEASSNLARYDGIRYGFRAEKTEDPEDSRTEGFGDEVKRRIWAGTYILSAGNYGKYYDKARKAREILRGQFDAAFEKCGVLLSPSAPDIAPEFGIAPGADMYGLFDRCAVPANLAGLPAISVPCGMKNNMPLGFQLTGRRFGDAELLGFARAFERGTNNKWSNLVAEVK
jgi:aspartyl-tRNA(Asn)/glutamyl-tRNA(Gln) amidotransferase subunit A